MLLKEEINIYELFKLVILFHLLILSLFLIVFIAILFIIGYILLKIPIFIINYLNKKDMNKIKEIILAMNNLEEKKENISDLEYLLECNRLMKLYKNVLN